MAHVYPGFRDTQAPLSFEVSSLPSRSPGPTREAEGMASAGRCSAEALLSPGFTSLFHRCRGELLAGHPKIRPLLVFQGILEPFCTIFFFKQDPQLISLHLLW